MLVILSELTIILAQSTNATSEIEAASQNEALTLGAFVAAVGAVILGMARIIGPAIAKRIQQSQATASSRAKHELEQSQREDELSMEAKMFLTEHARDSMESVRSIAEECRDEVRELRAENRKYLIELGELRASDRIREEEIDALRSEVLESKDNLAWTKEALASSQTEMIRMQSKIAGLQREVETLRSRASTLENKLKTQEEVNDNLERELSATKAKLEDREYELGNIKEKHSKSKTMVDKLRAKVWEYRHRYGKLPDSDSRLNTDELLGLDRDGEDE